MRDYAELINHLRECGTRRDCLGCPYDSDKSYCIEPRIIQAADAIEELLAAVPKWISVEERLPKEWEPVYAAVRSEGREDWVIEVAVYDPYLTCPWGHIPMIENGKAEVYAWMPRPLPEPPKED